MRAPQAFRPGLGWRLLLAFALAHLVFAALPGIDLAVSRFFFREAGFPLVESAALSRLRYVLWYSCYLLALGGLLLWPAWYLAGPRRRVPARVWGFVGLTFLAGPGLVVNRLLKAHWGRARPADIAEFGGSESFTPAWQIADHCARNCSFTSGEGAAASTLALVVGILAWPHLGRRGRRRLALALGAFVVLTSGLRVATGRHFLSDVVFSFFVCAFVALGVYRLLRIDWARPSMTPANLQHDLRLIAARLRRGPSRQRGGQV